MKNKKPVYYKQFDPRWAGKPYNGKGENDKTIKSSGCGPTCAAMCIASLADPGVTPVETCAWSQAHGFKYANQGTADGYFVPQRAAYGIACRQLPGSRVINKPDHPVHDQVKEYLAQGYWVIALVGRKANSRGFWTSGGHFLLVWEWDDKVRILDPASSKASRANGDPYTFRNEARQYWLVDARKFNGKVVDDLTTDEVRKIAQEVAEKAAQDVAKQAAQALASATDHAAQALRAAQSAQAAAVAAAQTAEKAMPTVYQTLEDVPEWYRPTAQKLVDKGVLKGTGGGALNVSAELCRTLTLLDRCGVLD